MHFSRTLATLGAAAAALMIACSDSGVSSPDLGRASLGTTGQTDTAKTKPDTTKPKTDTTVTTKPDSTGQVKPSSDPRPLVGTVIGMGPQPDTANYVSVTGATVVLTTPDDSTSGTAGLELARTTSKADGSFALGSFKPGVYMITVTPPDGSPFRSVHWGFLIEPTSPATVKLSVWLGWK